jgi:hypothetical protein
MKIISERIAHKLRAHTCRWQGLPEVIVPSAAVSDEDTAKWSAESLARDLDADKPSQFRRLAALTVFGAILAGSVIGTGVAKADVVTDIAYLATLDQFGVYYNTDQTAITLGHSVCDALASGLTPTTIVRIGQRTGYSPTDAGYIVGAAIGAYCDQYSWMIGMPSGRVAA